MAPMMVDSGESWHSGESCLTKTVRELRTETFRYLEWSPRIALAVTSGFTTYKHWCISFASPRSKDALLIVSTWECMSQLVNTNGTIQSSNGSIYTDDWTKMVLPPVFYLFGRFQEGPVGGGHSTNSQWTASVRMVHEMHCLYLSWGEIHVD